MLTTALDTGRVYDRDLLALAQALAGVAHDQAQPKPEAERALPGQRLWPKCSSSSRPYDDLFLATRSAHERAGMPGDCVRGMNPDWCAVCQKVNHGDIGFPGTYGYPARLRGRC